MNNDKKNNRKKKLQIEELNIEELESAVGGATATDDPVAGGIGDGVVRPNTGQPLPILFS